MADTPAAAAPDTPEPTIQEVIQQVTAQLPEHFHPFLINGLDGQFDGVHEPCFFYSSNSWDKSCRHTYHLPVVDLADAIEKARALRAQDPGAMKPSFRFHAIPSLWFKLDEEQPQKCHGAPREIEELECVICGLQALEVEDRQADEKVRRLRAEDQMQSTPIGLLNVRYVAEEGSAYLHPPAR